MVRKLPCRIILVIREEYLGQLYPLEREIPTLFDHRLRIEPMNNARVLDVLEKSFDQFNITLEAPAAELRQAIIDNVSAGKSGIQLPYLQVYLDMFYREDYRRDYGERERGDELPPLQFTRREIEAFGKIDDVLERFLREQTEALQANLVAEHSGLPANAVRMTLDAFVTEDGTKRPVFLHTHEGELRPEAPFQPLFPELSPLVLTDCLRRLEQSRLLRITDNSAELAHDSLASLIDGQRTDEQRQRNEVKRRITAAHLEQEKTGIWPTERQLLSMEEFLPRIRLAPHLQQFVQDSYAEVERKKEEAERERQRKLEEAQRQAAIEKELADKANAALADLRAKNNAIFQSFTELGTDLIYTLDHAEALEKMKVAVEIDVDGELKRQQLTEPVAELLYFFAEGGRRPKLARAAAGLLLRLEPEDDLAQALQECIRDGWETRRQFAPLLEQLPFFPKFRARYYPVTVAVPLGEEGVFEMGSPESEWGHQSDEQLHQVKLSPYQMAATPVTFYQFALFSEAVDRGLASRTPYWGRFGDHPVVSVSWYEAIEYANWLNAQQGRPPVYSIQKEKNSDPGNQVRLDYLKWKVDWDTAAKGFRLPTEAEWELAARGGVGAPRTLFAGSDTLDEVGWYWENSGDKPLSGDWDLNRIYDNNGRTHTAQEKRDNGIGLYDMSGNVYEWCWDWYDAGYYEECLQNGVTLNPLGAKSSADGRVIRGGSWGGTAEDCRVADRFRSSPDSRYHGVGFRLVFVP
jgi:formylglycine-generating enzyme required for sulfatase activity